MKSRLASEHVKAYQYTIMLQKQRRRQPQLCQLDNEASTLLRDFITGEKIAYQLTPPNVKHSNTAERELQTFKNHLVAGVCSMDPNFPLSLWDEILHQAIIALNLLHASRINPWLSAYAQVQVAFNFNHTPLVSPGTRVLLHEKPSIQEKWAPHAVDGWYLGPALHYY